MDRKASQLSYEQIIENFKFYMLSGLCKFKRLCEIILLSFIPYISNDFSDFLNLFRQKLL